MSVAIAKMMPDTAAATAEMPAPVAGYMGPPSQPAVAPTDAFILAMEYAGRFRVIGSASLDYLSGMAQNLPGTKRLFKEVPGQAEYQEIKANGEAIHRT